MILHCYMKLKLYYYSKKSFCQLVLSIFKSTGRFSAVDSLKSISSSLNEGQHAEIKRRIIRSPLRMLSSVPVVDTGLYGDRRSLFDDQSYYDGINCPYTVAYSAAVLKAVLTCVRYEA